MMRIVRVAAAAAALSSSLSVGSTLSSAFVVPNRRIAPKLRSPRQNHLLLSLSLSTNQENERSSSSAAGWLERFVRISRPAVLQNGSSNSQKHTSYRQVESERDNKIVQLLTLFRVCLPSIAAGVVATTAFPALALSMAKAFSEPGVLAVLSQDSSQFVQNFLTVAGLLFSILVGQTYYFLYTQQESIYYALFNEVTEAKSLLEQVALICSGRSMYPRCLESISRYVESDLKKIQSDPAVLLSARPVDDPLESIMYMTSVGVPSSVYETVKSLREARAARLGALQRKLPSIHILLLWILAAIELVSFPLLGAGTQTIGGYNVLTVEGVLFGVMTAGIVLTLRVVGELWRPAGGAYNVDAVLSVMVRGLEEELKARMAGSNVYGSHSLSPSAPSDSSTTDFRSSTTNRRMASPPPQQQGANVGVAVARIYHWIRRRITKQKSTSKKPS